MPTLPSKTNAPLIKAPRAEVAEFLEQLKSRQPTSRGRLIFALDATASREKTWDVACRVQHEMFEATAGLGGVAVKLAYYRDFEECKASQWVYSTAELHRIMSLISCIAGATQIERILTHALREASDRKVDALVFVGDCVEEKVDQLCHLAGELGALGTPIFLFHEGDNPVAAAAFKQMAAVSRGVYLPFDLSSIDRLKHLLGGIATFVAGGYQALEAYGKKHGGEALLRLTAQMRR